MAAAEEDHELVHVYIYVFFDSFRKNRERLGEHDEVTLKLYSSCFKFIHTDDELYSVKVNPLVHLVEQGILVLPKTAYVQALHYLAHSELHFWVKIGIPTDSAELVSQTIFDCHLRVSLDIRPGGLSTECDYIFGEFDDIFNQVFTKWKTSRQFRFLEEKQTSVSMLTPHVVKFDLLSEHQRQGLVWMLGREEYADVDAELPPFWEERNGVYKAVFCHLITLKLPPTIKGGIFADESGMGKTFTLLSLIASTKKSHFTKKKRKFSGHQWNPTLVVCPPSVVSSWKQQIELWTWPGTLHYCTYSQRCKTRDTNWLMQHDLVLTTYDMVGKPDSLLYQVEWWRVILDDAHLLMKEQETLPPLIHLKAKRRWAVTGKPVHLDFENYLLDPIMFFLGLPLHYTSVSPQLKQEVLTGIFSLRRTMPVKCIEDRVVTLSKDEQATYDLMEAKARAAYSAWQALKSFSKYNGRSLQTAVLRLWLSCHSLELLTSANMVSKCINIQEVSRKPELLKKVVNVFQEDKDYACPVCMDQAKDFVITRCAHMFCRSCMTRLFEKFNSKSRRCPLCRALLTTKHIFSSQRGPPVVDTSYGKMSSKVSALLKLLAKSRTEDPSRKCIVLSQFQRILAPVTRALLKAGFDVKCMDVVDSAKKKATTVKDFTNADAPVILLTTFKVLSKDIPKGLDLSAASSNVYMLEPCWSMQNEREVLNCIHGCWKNEDIKIVRLVCKDTLEERVLTLRESDGPMEGHLSMDYIGCSPRSEVYIRSIVHYEGLFGFYEDDSDEFSLLE